MRLYIYLYIILLYVKANNNKKKKYRKLWMHKYLYLHKYSYQCVFYFILFYFSWWWMMKVWAFDDLWRHKISSSAKKRQKDLVTSWPSTLSQFTFHHRRQWKEHSTLFNGWANDSYNRNWIQSIGKKKEQEDAIF